MAACALVILGVAWMEASERWRVLSAATAKNLSEFPPHSVRVAPGCVERHTVLPVTGIDGKWWALHAETLGLEGRWRVRETRLDNAPEGREVHWSSGLVWFLALLSGLFSAGPNPPPAGEAVALAALWSGPALFVILTAVYAGWFARRFGPVPAGFAALLLGLCGPAAAFFRAGDCDHHGLAGWFLMMGLLSLAAARLAERRAGEKALRGSAAAAGLFTAGGVWVSAATALPVVAATGVAALADAVLNRRRPGAALPPEFWRVWGLAGGLGCLGFYLLEYFPDRMGMRLEVNHPLYAAAWMAGGSLLARLTALFRAAEPVRFARENVWRGLGEVFLILLPAGLIKLFPGRVFWVADPFLFALHDLHISEFQPLAEAVDGPAAGIVLAAALALPVCAAAAVAAAGLARLAEPARLSGLLLAGVPAAGMLLLALRQARWIGIAAFLWAALAAVVAALVWQRRRERPVTAALALGALLLACAPHPFLTWRFWLKGREAPGAIPKDLGPNIVARDIAHRLIQTSERPPVILSGPTTSTDLAYYGRTPVIGTLYWENMPGLKAAARIFSATDEETARRLLLERGVTHIVLFSWDMFLKEYRDLLGPEAPEGRMFLERLLEGEAPPQWMRPLYYPALGIVGLDGERVHLFEIRPDQTRADWLAWRAQYALDAGRAEEAVKLAREALEAGPGNARARAVLEQARRMTPGM